MSLLNFLLICAPNYTPFFSVKQSGAFFLSGTNRIQNRHAFSALRRDTYLKVPAFRGFLAQGAERLPQRTSHSREPCAPTIGVSRLGPPGKRRLFEQLLDFLCIELYNLVTHKLLLGIHLPADFKTVVQNMEVRNAFA